MVLVLCVGDTLIPYKNAALNDKFRNLLKPGKIDTVLALGNVCDEPTREFLKTLASSTDKSLFLLGDVDEARGSRKDSTDGTVVDVTGARIAATRYPGVQEGSDAFLDSEAKRLAAQVLVVGGGNALRIEKRADTVVVIPGPGCTSFALLDVKREGKIAVYGYSLKKDNGEEVNIEKFDFELS
jgi:predicted phosphodiesterase